MLIDTHCHINIMVKSTFDTLLEESSFVRAQEIIEEARAHDVKRIINVGTSLIESQNCVMLARQFENVWASIGIHPNDCTPTWKKDLTIFKKLLKEKENNKIVAIGECGIDRHYPDYNLQMQKDVFKAQIELALEHDVALIVHSRDAYDETLRSLEEFKGEIKRGVIHCFSEDLAFAQTVIDFGLVLGIGGTVTYPKNEIVRSVAATIPLTKIILETDAPFLPPQIIRGKQNQPLYIETIARYLAQLRGITFDAVAEQTTATALQIFNIV
jgi:TatD DNase family protein